MVFISCGREAVSDDSFSFSVYGYAEPGGRIEAKYDANSETLRITEHRFSSELGAKGTVEKNKVKVSKEDIETIRYELLMIEKAKENSNNQALYLLETGLYHHITKLAKQNNKQKPPLE